MEPSYFRKILVPLDGSELAERALVPALAFSKAMSSQIIFVRVIDASALPGGQDLYQRMIERHESEVKYYLRSLQSRSLFSEIDTESVTAAGRPAESIINFAQENDVDMIVISSHGRSGIGRWVYGSVADKVLHGATCNISLIHPQVIIEPFSYKRILVPLDGSPLAEQALEPALALAEAVSAELILLRAVVLPLVPVEPVPGWPGMDAVMDIAGDEARRYLLNIKGALAKSPVPTKVEVVLGPTASEIIDYADGEEIDLIVMSSRGLSGIGRWVFGSVTEKVLRGARCATLVIR
ncbi:MAG: universal stress protein [Candidatus Promineifilaceae bacterium]